MICVLHHVYGMEDKTSYFRKVGSYCFEFTWDKSYASILSAEEVEKVMKYADWYCKQYGASYMTVENAE